MIYVTRDVIDLHIDFFSLLIGKIKLCMNIKVKHCPSRMASMKTTN